MDFERIGIVLLFYCFAFLGLVLAISPALAIIFLAVRAAPLEGLFFATEPAGQQALGKVVNLNFIASVILTIWFVRKQYSLQRLWVFVIVLWPVFYLLSRIGRLLRDLLADWGLVMPDVDSVGLAAIVLSLGALAYVLPYLFVYHGGYGRVKTWVSLKQ